MGKRELLIVSLFIVIGVIADQLTAPSSAARPSQFSWSAIVDAWRSGGSRPSVTASHSTSGAIPLDGTITELRVSNIARIIVTGSARRNIEYELTVDASGPDEVSASHAARGATLSQDRVGPVLALRLDQLRGRRSTATLTLVVPSRLELRTDGGPGTARLDVRDIAGVHLGSIVGDVRISGIAGAVTGSHRNGDLTTTDVRTVHLTLVSSKARVEAVHEAVTISARNGRLHIAGARGPAELDLNNQQTTIEGVRDAVHVLGAGGTLQVIAPPAPVTIDVRRMSVDVRLDRAVPIAVLTADAPIHLGLVGPPALALDATTGEGGRIRVQNLPIALPSETRLVHAFGGATSTVALRNQRADIVIEMAK